MTFTERQMNMAIPKISKQNIIDALKYIDQNGVPAEHQSFKYKLLIDDGKKYPPKYVIAVAAHLADGREITTASFNAGDAKNYLEKLGFSVDYKQEKYELTITADSITSTDDRFTMDNLSLGDNYKPLGVYLQKENGEIVKRVYSKGERRNSNQTLPKLACQVYEKQIAGLSVEEKENFPICRYGNTNETICGIYSSVQEFKKHRNTIEYFIYNYDNGRQFVIYCWNIFQLSFSSVNA